MRTINNALIVKRRELLMSSVDLGQTTLSTLLNMYSSYVKQEHNSSNLFVSETEFQSHI